MVDQDDPYRNRVRLSVYGLLIAIAIGSGIGRICAVTTDFETPTPFLSPNDRSRWATVRALVELGTYEIDQIVSEPNWNTIDMVKHDADGDGVARLYSSKPPLLATVIAVPYWMLHKLTGKTLGSHPYELGRCLLIVINVIPLVIFTVTLGHFIERAGVTDWGRVFVMACACFATFLSAFIVTLNNHLVAAVSVMVAMHCLCRVLRDEHERLKYYVGAGFFSTFAATVELPAAIVPCLFITVLLCKSPRRTLKGFLPAALVPVSAFLFTNYIAHRSLIVPYATINAVDPEQNWYIFEYERNGQTLKSYWHSPSGVDRGELSRLVYATHFLVGHHGIFSLTPVWLLAVIGVIVRAREGAKCDQLTWITVIASVVCIAFYICQPTPQRNFGGVTVGLRWLLWLTPFWLTQMLRATDRMAATRWQRWLALLLLSWSVASTSFATRSPWVHPWLFDFMQYLGILDSE